MRSAEGREMIAGFYSDIKWALFYMTDEYPDPRVEMVFQDDGRVLSHVKGDDKHVFDVSMLIYHYASESTDNQNDERIQKIARRIMWSVLDFFESDVVSLLTDDVVKRTPDEPRRYLGDYMDIVHEAPPKNG